MTNKSDPKSTRHVKAPRWAIRLLYLFCNPDFIAELEEDLDELYQQRISKLGLRKAQYRYWIDVLSLARPPFLKKKAVRFEFPFNASILYSYMKSGWRNLTLNTAFSAINIVGLSIGLATCMLISLYVADELSYDRYHKKADRIVRVVLYGTMNGTKIRQANVMPPVAQTLRAEYPEVLEATRLKRGGNQYFSHGAKTFKENDFAYADSNFFQVFTLPFLKGDIKTALARPNTIVVTSTVAQKYFGNVNPIGRLLTTDNGLTTYTVTGVISPVPTRSHFKFSIYASMATLPEAKEQSWLQSGYFTYLVLPSDYDYRSLQAKLAQVTETYMAPQFEKMMGVSLRKLHQTGSTVELSLQPLTDIHLYSDFTNDLLPPGNIQSVYIFSVIALFMLVIACINFLNLSTAKASKRAKEVGVRKVLGSAKSQLIGQFLAEATVLTAFSLLIAVELVDITLPFLNDLSGKEMQLDYIQTPWLVPLIILFGLMVGLLSGGYPAFFLSSLTPVSVLKGGVYVGLSTNRSSLTLRSGLVVFQFFVSISLIIGTVVVYHQLKYIQQTKLGYQKEQVLIIEETFRLGANEQVFRDKLLQDSRIADASVSGHLPTGPSNDGQFSVYPDHFKDQATRIARYGIDQRYLATLGMDLVAGRNFSPAFASDSSAVIINETAAKAFGWKKSALGHTLNAPNYQGIITSYHIIGVVNDFHFRSLHERIAPLAMVLGDNAGSTIVKAKAGDLAGLLASVTNLWSTFNPKESIQFSFLDQSYEATYQAELKTSKILGIFAGLTIFVACLGLFGLATFTTEQRIKEIGVRKVLGASVTNIVALLSSDFLKPVLIAIVFATPFAGYSMYRWLENFAYRIEMPWWAFMLAALLAISVALVTVSYHSLRAALMNPVESLRSE